MIIANRISLLFCLFFAIKTSAVTRCEEDNLKLSSALPEGDFRGKGSVLYFLYSLPRF
jgi:hypothetical protein